jgi:hypothetical protein
VAHTHTHTHAHTHKEMEMETTGLPPSSSDAAVLLPIDSPGMEPSSSAVPGCVVSDSSVTDANSFESEGPVTESTADKSGEIPSIAVQSDSANQLDETGDTHINGTTDMGVVIADSDEALNSVSEPQVPLDEADIPVNGTNDANPQTEPAGFMLDPMAAVQRYVMVVEGSDSSHDQGGDHDEVFRRSEVNMITPSSPVTASPGSVSTAAEPVLGEAPSLVILDPSDMVPVDDDDYGEGYSVDEGEEPGKDDSDYVYEGKEGNNSDAESESEVDDGDETVLEDEEEDFMSDSEQGTHDGTMTTSVDTEDNNDDYSLNTSGSLNMLATVESLDTYDEQGLALITDPESYFDCLQTGPSPAPSSEYAASTDDSPTSSRANSPASIGRQQQQQQQHQQQQRQRVPERLSMHGIINIARNLETIYGANYVQGYMQMTLRDRWVSDEWHHLGCANPVFSYLNDTLPGWRRDITLNIGKSQGTLLSSYMPPDGSRRVKSKHDLKLYLESHETTLEELFRANLQPYVLSSEAMPRTLELKTVYCVCHQPAMKGPYLECSYGFCGCQGWVHPECVGLGPMTEEEMEEIESVVCPLCTCYLEGINDTASMENKMFVQDFSFAML